MCQSTVVLMFMFIHYVLFCMVIDKTSKCLLQYLHIIQCCIISYDKYVINIVELLNMI
jgi:hypothetical protein